jgi:2'-5' RNA ligase
MAAIAERAVVELGFEPEPRPFRTHLTLARLREPADVRKLFPTLPQDACALHAVTLYASKLGNGPPIYTVLARCAF